MTLLKLRIRAVIFLAATLLLSYDRTFPQLQTFNLTAKVDFQKPPGPFDLSFLEVRYESDVDGRLFDYVTEPDSLGLFTMTVWPSGTLKISARARFPEKASVWYFGHTIINLSAYNHCTDPNVVCDSIRTPLFVVTRQAAAGVPRSSGSLERVPLIHLVRFEVPTLGQLAPSPSRPTSNQGCSHPVATIDVAGNPDKLLISATDAATGNDVPPLNPVQHGKASYKADESDAIFITIEARGMQSRTLLLYGRGCEGELYDEGNKPLGYDVQITMTPETPSAKETLDEGSFSIESARRVNFDANLISTLPLALFRNPDALLGLAPGYAPAPQGFGISGPSLSPGIGTVGSFAINGTRSRDNNFTIDGSDYNDEEFGVRRQGFVTPFPQPIDSIGYYQAVTANGDARYGRSLGGDINVLSKAGGPKAHLSAYAFGTGGVLDAKEYFQTNIQQYPAQYQQLVPITGDGSLTGTPAKFNLGQGYQGLITVDSNNHGFQANPLQETINTSRISYGATGGGPLGLAKTYWFASYERELQDGNTEQSFSVPTVRERGIGLGGDYGDTGGSVAGNPNNGCNSYFYYPYYYCPQQNSRFYPATVSGDAILSLFPFPNNPLGPYGTNTYTAVLPNNAHGYVGSARIDKEMRIFDRASTFTVRVNYTKDSTDLPSVGGAIFSSLRANIRTTNVATYFTTALSSRFFNTFRFSYGNSAAEFSPLASPLLPSDAITNSPEAGYLLNAPLLFNVTPIPSMGVAVYDSPSLTGLTESGALPTHPVVLTDDSESVTGPIGQVNIVGYSPVGVDVYHFPQTRNDYTVQIADTLSITAGRSISYVGIDTRVVNLNSYEDRNARPYAEFHGSPAFPSSVGLAAAGLPTGVYQTLGVKPESSVVFSQRQLEIFGQEYFRAKPNLTISGGLRLELGVLPNANGRVQSAFNPTLFGQQVDAARSQCAVNPLLIYYFQQEECIAVAHALGTAFNGNFEQVFGSGFQGVTPRVGLAWDASGDGRVVVRTGWGMYKSAFPSAVIDETRSAFDEFLPLNSTVPGDFYNLPNPSSPGFSPFCNCGYGLGIPLQPGTLNLLPTGTNPVEALANSLLALRPVLITKLQQPYSMQFNSTVEVGIGALNVLEIAYVGSLGRRLIVASTPQGGFGMKLPNFSLLGADIWGFPMYGVTPDSPAYDNPYYETPTAPPVLSEQYQSSASSSYNSLQLSFQRRLSNGIQGGISFTYSHTLDYSSDFFDTAGEYALPANSQSPKEWGNSAYDVRFRTSGWFLWQLPSILHDKLTADWHLSGIVTQQGGQPFTVNTSVDLNQDGNATDRPVSTGGLRSAGRRRVQLLATQPVSQWAYPHNGVSAEIGRNTFRSSGYSVVDTGVYRELEVPKVGWFTMRCDVFNLFNHPAFGIPVRILEAPAFGSSVSTVVPPRSIQFGLKFSF
jgi:hypothetical protein